MPYIFNLFLYIFIYYKHTNLIIFSEMTTPSDVIVVISGIQYNLVPAETTPTETIDIKEKIKQQFSSSNVDVNSLKKVIKGEVKKVQLRNGSSVNRMIFTLDDNSIVGFNYASTFYFVNKETKNISIESYADQENEFGNNKVFDTYDVYIDVDETKRNVYIPNIVTAGGCRKKHRKSAKRVKYTKKSSQTRMRK
jgi:hypothetical protein